MTIEEAIIYGKKYLHTSMVKMLISRVTGIDTLDQLNNLNYVFKEKEEKEGAERRSKIGTGDRSEKIRTYNYPQNRVTDHRIGFSTMQLEKVMDGALDDIIEALITEDQARKLRGE